MKPATIPQIKLRGADIDAHLRRLNTRLPGPITEIGAYMRTLGVQESSFNVYLSQIKSALRETLGDAYHFKSGLRHQIDTYFSSLRKNVPDSQKVRTIPWDDIATLIVRGGIKTATLLETYCRTGLRVSELINARWANLRRTQNGYELFVIGKGRKKRWIAFPSDLVPRIKSVFKGKTYLIETGAQKQYLRQEIYWLFSKGARKHLGYSFGPHALRHTFTTDVYETWPNLLMALARQLGHKDVNMTMRYIHQGLKSEHLPAAPQASLFASIQDTKKRKSA